MKAQEPIFDMSYDEFMKAAREVLDRCEPIRTEFGTITAFPMRYAQRGQMKMAWWIKDEHQ